MLCRVVCVSYTKTSKPKILSKGRSRLVFRVPPNVIVWRMDGDKPALIATMKKGAKGLHDLRYFLKFLLITIVRD